MQQLNSTDQLRVEDRNWGAEWYDGVGGSTFLSATTVPLGTEKVNSAPEIFSMDSNILTISEAGLYFFSYQVTAANSGSSEMIYHIYLEQDPDNEVFTLLPATTIYNTFFSGWGTALGNTIVQVGINYRYRLQAARIGGLVTPTFLLDQSKLSVIRLFKNG